MATEIRVPTLGESVAEATVASWFKRVGDPVKADEPVCELETDKVTLEVPSPATGVIAEILAGEGENVGVNALLATISDGAGVKPAAPPAASKEKAEAAAPAEPPPARRDPEDAPSAKRLMAERGIARDAVAPSGRDGRVMKEDVQRAIDSAQKVAADAAQAASQEAAARPESDGEERVPMSRLRQTIARRLKEAQNTAAMLTTYNEVDMTRVIEFRAAYKEVFQKKYGAKLGFMSFFVKACCNALVEVPDVNAEIDGTDIVYKRFVHMGIAVGTPTGLVVPVVRNAHKLTFAEVELQIAQLGARARDGKLTMSEMQGGTFSISNGGVYGSLMSSPILNPPQSGILGMHKIQERPIAVDGKVEIRPMMYLALSYDHRIVDGKGAVTFLVRVKESIEDPRRLLMEV